ncbi:hypothetical protein TPA0908_63090 [Micromonospora sp. AKA38]|nr:hypothetical protein TPA0908_63090 [Micromonospora sp. AKA38]
MNPQPPDAPPPAPGHPPNPFAVPRLGSTDPLNPLWYAEHVNYYVPVDNTEASFEQCQGRFADVAHLHHEGRLVLVRGERGCGKTALVNRCAHWLRDRLGRDGLRAEVVNLRQEAHENDPIPTRREHTCRALLDKLNELQLLRHNLAYEMRDRPDDAYRNLPGCLDTDQALIVLLPPVELIEELHYYAARAPRRMVFFAETTSALDRRDRDVLGRNTVHLEVDGFDHRHAARFAADRLGRLTPGLLPPLADTALEEYIDDGRLATIREMQWLLFGVYETLRVQDERPNQVTWQDLARHFMREARRLREQP